MGKFDEFTKVLKMDKRFFGENGDFLRNVAYESGMKMDKSLITNLANNATTKEMFFTEVGDKLVFDKVEFGWAVNNKNILPDYYTRYKNKIGLIDGNENYISKSEDVQLVFPYKDCLLEFDSTKEDDEREEVFYNELLAKNDIDYLLMPKVYSNAKLHNSNGCNNIDKFDFDDNLIIKGNNLLAMHSLLPRYEEKIKMMYWDVLYNTESDKVPYSDTFKHSSWLGMMKDRLKVAYRLLSKNGVLCMQCDDNEQAYLKVLTDEIFGRENFVNCIAIKMSEATGVKMSHADKRLPKLKEYILIYKKNEIEMDDSNILIPISEWGVNYNKVVAGLSKEELSRVRELMSMNSISDDNLIEFDSLVSKMTLMSFQEAEDNWDKLSEEERLNWKYENAYRIVRETSSASAKKIADIKSEKTNADFFGIKTAQNKLYLIKNNYNKNAKDPNIKMLFAIDYLFINPCDFWNDIKTTRVDQEGNVELTNGKKPEKILQRLLYLLTKENDIVLDAYFGTGTTGAVAMKMNRKFIGIEQLDSHYDKCIKRLETVISGDKTGISNEMNWNGGGSFVSVELSKLNEKYLDEIKSAEEEDFDRILSEILYTGFISCKINPKDINSNAEDFKSLPIDDKRNFLCKLLDKNYLYINYTDIDDNDYEVSEIDKSFTKSFYEVN